MKFRIYYADGSRVDHEHPGLVQRRWEVQCVVFDDPRKAPHPDTVGRVVLCRFEYYLWHQEFGYWFGVRSESDFLDWMLNPRGGYFPVAWLKGSLMDRDKFEALYDRARSEPGFAAKSMTNRYEECGLT